MKNEPRSSFSFHVFVLLILVLHCFSVVSSSPSSPSSPSRNDANNEKSSSRKTLKVMTFNFYKSKDQNWRERLPRVLTLLQDVNPDVVAIQGLISSQETQPSIGQVEELRKLLNSTTYDGSIVSYENKETAEKGQKSMMILTRGKVSSKSLFRKIGKEGKETAVLYLPVEFEGQKFHFFTTEWSAFPKKDADKDKDLKASQSQQSLLWIRKMTRDFSTGPVVFLGDFHQTSKDQTYLAELEEQFIDSWQTYQRRNKLREKDGYTFVEPERKKKYRSDRIFIKGDLAIETVLVRGTPGELSDHSPLVAELSVTPSPTSPSPTSTPTATATAATVKPSSRPVSPTVISSNSERKTSTSNSSPTLSVQVKEKKSDGEYVSTSLSSTMVIGGVLGVLLIIALVIVVAFWWKRRAIANKKKRQYIIPNDEESFNGISVKV